MTEMDDEPFRLIGNIVRVEHEVKKGGVNHQERKGANGDINT